MPRSSQQLKFLGASGVINHRRPNKHHLKQIKEKHTNHLGEFQHKNPRTKKHEHIQLEEIKRLKNNKHAFILKGTSPNDGKPLTRIIHHKPQ